MRLRYAFRLYPDAVQQAALARAFGCARVVFNDALRAREDARQALLAQVHAGEPEDPEVTARAPVDLVAVAYPREARVAGPAAQFPLGGEPFGLRRGRPAASPSPA